MLCEFIWTVILKFSAFVILLFIPSYIAAAANIDHCKQEWKSIINSNITVNEAINKWKEQKQECSGSGFYERNLIQLYINSKNYESARLEAKNSIEKQLPGRSAFKIMYLDTLFFEYIERGENNRKKWEELETQYSKYLYSNLSLAYIRVSDININLGNYKKAKRIAMEGINLSPEWGLYRNIMLANYNLKKYSEVPYNFKSAYTLNKKLIGNKNLMLTLSRSYIELEEWMPARNTLINLRKAVPKIEFDQDYIDTALLLKQRMVEAGVIE